MKRFGFGLVLLLVVGCGGIETTIFPLFPPAPFDEPPAPLGPYGFTERRIELADLGDGAPGGITVFEPVGAEGLRPTLVWVLGVNNQPYYHQSFHEYMASWGYIQVIADTRRIQFSDTQYNKRNTDVALRAFDLAASNAEGLACDPNRIAFGGYSVGASMAAFAAAQEPRARALVLWAPAPALVWQGVDPNALLPQVTAPSLFLEAEFDNVVGEWPAQMRTLMTQSVQTQTVVAGGVHLQFQQPDFPAGTPGRNDPVPTISRSEQMRQAEIATREYLNAKMP